jgi:hypothetical protein
LWIILAITHAWEEDLFMSIIEEISSLVAQLPPGKAQSLLDFDRL